MTRLTVDGAVYGFALPDGSYGATYADHIASSQGDITYPGEDILFLVGTRYDGVLYLAGQGHRTDTAWLYNGTWRDCGPAYGVSPCAFGDGTLFISASPTHYRVIDLATGDAHDVPTGLGSQGIRYIEHGVPVSGDATYTLQTPYGWLHEYTRRGDVLCGQAHEGDWALVNGRVLEQGTCRFIRLERAGDQLAIATAKFGEHRVVFHWLSVSEIANLPTLGTNQPDPGTPAPPQPAPPPQEPQPIMQLPPNVKAIRDAYVAKFPVPQMAGSGPSDEPFENVCRAWIKALAEQVVFATNDPTWGCKNAGGGRPQSKDGLARNLTPKLYSFDLLTGVGTGHPALVADPHGEDITGQTFMPVSPVNHLGATPEPQPDAEPEQPSVIIVEIEHIHGELDVLKATTEVLNSDNAYLRDALAALTARVVALETKPLPKFRIKGGTSRTFAHAHMVELEVVKE